MGGGTPANISAEAHHFMVEVKEVVVEALYEGGMRGGIQHLRSVAYNAPVSQPAFGRYKEVQKPGKISLAAKVLVQKGLALGCINLPNGSGRGATQPVYFKGFSQRFCASVE